MASACKSLRDCERWRGEILREISRKVAKIQDSGLTDYEVRDLNDEINKLMREKRHWENQIIALGGANYRRNVAMLDDDGKEVPGTKGYKYFGRAKDLPGVKELFSSRKKDEEEENQALSYYKKFMNQGPAYFGDLDESDGKVLECEQTAEEEDWEEAYTNLKAALGLPTEFPTPKIPRPNNNNTTPPTNSASALAAPPNQAKRKAPDWDSDINMTDSTEEASLKRSKTPIQTKENPADASSGTDIISEPQMEHARAAAAFISFLTSESLLPPKLPTREEMERVLLNLRKRALVEEYFGNGDT
jgi:pre-mRNA-splicing factor ISY1